LKKLIIEGGIPLKGIVKVSGAKNAVLPVIAAALLSDGVSYIDDTPWLADVRTMCKALECMGIRSDFSKGLLALDTAGLCSTSAPEEFVRKMRASFLIMGPILSKMGQAEMSLPGGCAIGSRPINLHLKGFEAMGAQITLGSGRIAAQAKKLKGARIYLDFPSVGATENIMMAATLAEGVTVIENAAEEPEIVDLANFLGAMGAKIKGAGTKVIRIEGVSSLSPARHTVIPDRVEAGTFMVAAAATGGSVLVDNVIEEHIKSVSAKLQETGSSVEESYGSIKVSAGEKIIAADVKTLSYPGFPTDMQAQIMALLARADGCSIITETIFENRFMHAAELRKMGADIKIEGHSAVVNGKPKLRAANLSVTDLRAGGAMIIAALTAKGKSEITGIHHLERGYEDIYQKLAALGAYVKLVED